MTKTFCLITAVSTLLLPIAMFGQQPEDSPPSAVKAIIETTLETADGQIRQFAYDGDPDSYFASVQSPSKQDHFTLVLDEPVMLTSVAVVTGRGDGTDRLAQGILEASEDGEAFESLGRIVDGQAISAGSSPRAVRAIRIRPAVQLEHPLVVRQLTIDSQPPVAIFKYPVEFVIDVSDAPEMLEWAERVARICERAYPMINEELESEGYRPPHLVPMRLSSDYRGVAAVSRGRITGSVRYFQNNPGDIGAMVHETVHIVQNYRGRGNPSWLVEGVADYIRFFKYEPGRLGRINPQRARYNGSYRVSAAFLAYLVEEYDDQIVRKLNEIMRSGEYRDEVFEELTGKPLEELGEEWQATLQ